MSPPPPPPRKTRQQAAIKKQIKRNKRRQETLFASRRVIGPLDTIVDVNLGKVKIETPEKAQPSVVVKQEVEDVPDIVIKSVHTISSVHQESVNQDVASVSNTEDIVVKVEAISNAARDEQQPVVFVKNEVEIPMEAAIEANNNNNIGVIENGIPEEMIESVLKEEKENDEAIVTNASNEDEIQSDNLPASLLNVNDGNAISDSINGIPIPTACPENQSVGEVNIPIGAAIESTTSSDILTGNYEQTVSNSQSMDILLGAAVEVEEQNDTDIHCASDDLEKVEIPTVNEDDYNNAVLPSGSQDVHSPPTNQPRQEADDRCTSLFNHVLPHIQLDLPFGGILKLREVCRKWCLAVDNYLDNHPTMRPYTKQLSVDFQTNRVSSAFSQFPLVQRRIQTKPTARIYLSTVESVNAWLERTKEYCPSRNPFLTRNVFFKTPDEKRSIPKFWKLVVELVKCQGQHIWYLSLDFGITLSQHEIYMNLLQTLNHVPNLRSLTMSRPPGPFNTRFSDFQRNEAKQNPLPDMKYLEQLNISECYFEEFGTLQTGKDFLLRHLSSTIKSLQMSRPCVMTTQVFTRQNQPLQNLNDFHVTRTLIFEHFHRIFPPHLLSNNLIRLRLTFDTRVKVQELFEYLKEIQNLRVLQINLVENIEGKEGYHCNILESDNSVSYSRVQYNALCHVGIQTLELSLSNRQTTFNFLELLPSLENLHLNNIEPSSSNYQTDDSVCDGTISLALKKCLKTKSALCSNIWMLIPKLKAFTLSWRKIQTPTLCFTRESCEKIEPSSGTIISDMRDRKIARVLLNSLPNEKVKLFTNSQNMTDRQRDERLLTNILNHLKHHERGVPGKAYEFVLRGTVNTEKLLNLSERFKELKDNVNKNKTAYLFELVLPHLLTDLDFSTIPVLRQVCSRWKTTVDKLFETHPLHTPFTSAKQGDQSLVVKSNRLNNVSLAHGLSPQLNRKQNVFTICCRFNSAGAIRRFLDVNIAGGANPFPGRSVVLASPDINLFESQEIISYCNAASKLLRSHGQHIFYLSVNLQGPMTTYVALEKLLPCLPQLRSLEITTNSPFTNKQSWPYRAITYDAIPILGTVTSLDLRRSHLSQRVENMLLEMFSNSLKRALVKLPRSGPEELGSLLKNVTDLHVESVHNEHDFEEMLLAVCGGSRPKNTSLTKLTLSLTNSMTAKKLFQVLQHLKSLQVLKIVLPNEGEPVTLINSIRNNKHVRLPKLSSIRSLEIFLNERQTKFRFLKYLPRLETLHLEGYPSTRLEELITDDQYTIAIKRCIRWNNSSNPVVGSSIWNVLQSLTLFTIWCGRESMSERQYFTREADISPDLMTSLNLIDGQASLDESVSASDGESCDTDDSTITLFAPVVASKRKPSPPPKTKKQRQPPKKRKK